MNADNLQITEQQLDDFLEIQVAGDLIITNAKSLQRHIDKAIEENQYDQILNLSKIDYIDSFGIGVVVKTKSEIDKKKGRLRVVVNPTLMSLFEKCHLDDYIELQLEESQE